MRRILALSLFLTAAVGPAAGGDHSAALRVGDRDRTFLVHAPSSAQPGKPLPAVIVFHGGGGSARVTARMTGMNETADREGFLAVYPNGSGWLGDRLLTWNSGYCCGYALRCRIDDVSFVRALIGELVNRFGADPRRIYATGISNGGMMTYRVAAELSNLVAAAAPVAGSIGGKASASAPDYVIPTPAQPVPIVIFHGRKDRHILYDGGPPEVTLTPGRVDLPVSAAVSFWVKANGCAPTPAREVISAGKVVRESYTHCTNGADVVLYTLNDGAHSWPGGHRVWKRGDEPSPDLSANDVMWQFFREHTRPVEQADQLPFRRRKPVVRDHAGPPISPSARSNPRLMFSVLSSFRNSQVHLPHRTAK